MLFCIDMFDDLSSEVCIHPKFYTGIISIFAGILVVVNSLYIVFANYLKYRLDFLSEAS